MADAYTAFANTIVNDAVTYYIAERMIELAKRDLVIQKISDMYPLPQRMGKTLQVVQVQRLSLPVSQLVEGVTPSTNALTLTQVQVIVEQWGIVAALTDVVQLTTKHPMLNIAIDRVSMAMRETMEREDANVLMSATNVSYAGAATSRGTLAATDVLNTPLIIRMIALLEMRGATPFGGGGTWAGFMQPAQKADVLGSDQTFQQASSFSAFGNLQYGRIGIWMNTDWTQTNFFPFFVGVAAPTTAAATATKTQYTVGTSGTMSTGNYQAVIVGRDVTTDYERRVSVQSGNIAVTSPGSISFTFPSSTNYVYDLYVTAVGLTVPYLVASRQAAGSTYTMTTEVAGTEDTPPASPALGISVYTGAVVGKGAFGTCELNGMALQSFLTPATPSDSDPLVQRRKVGAKFMRKSFILENNYIQRFETSSAIDAVLPA